MPYFMRKEDGKFCVYQGTAKEPIKQMKCYDAAEDANDYMRALMANAAHGKSAGNADSVEAGAETSGSANWESMSAEEIMSTVGKDIDSVGDEIVTDPVTDDEQDKAVLDEDKKPLEDRFVVYKTKSGEPRWLAISNVAIQDREFETITDKAYDDAITLGQSLGYGELDLVHVPDTDVGDCNFMLRMGDGDEARLIEGGTWHTTPIAQKALASVQEDPSYWGVSIKFVYDPAQFTDGVYHGGIRIKKRTILPRHMAASYGTAIAVLGGEQMKELDKETRDALAKLGVEESKIEELAERSKSLPDEPNTVTKTDESPSILDQIKALINRALGNDKEVPEQETAQPDVAETVKTESEVAPVKETTQEPVEETKEADVEDVEPAVPSEEAVKVIAQTVAQSLAPSIQQAMQPMADSLAAIKQWQASIDKRLLETEKDIETKVVERIDSQPPVVKVAPTTTLKQDETDEPIPTITDSPAESQSAEFMKAVTDIVRKAMNSSLNMPEIKLSTTEEVSNE